MPYNKYLIYASVTFVTLTAFPNSVFGSIEVQHTRFRDNSARLESSWIENGCVSKSLVVFASETALAHDGSVKSGKSVTSITYTTYNSCDLNNTVQTFWYGESDNATIEVYRSLASACLSAVAFTLKGRRFAGLNETDLGTVSVAVDLRWQATDTNEVRASTFVTAYPGHHEVSRLMWPTHAESTHQHRRTRLDS
jgi:hypothetical protein